MAHEKWNKERKGEIDGKKAIRWSSQKQLFQCNTYIPLNAIRIFEIFDTFFNNLNFFTDVYEVNKKNNYQQKIKRYLAGEYPVAGYSVQP